MPAYAHHQMERDYSAQSLSSRGGSEIGSRYEYEPGFYISSFTATIFVAGLITVGILMISLVIALAIMLQSCQSHTSGVIETQNSLLDDDDEYCKIVNFQMELNQLDITEVPPICADYAVRYISHGLFVRDLNLSIAIVENYFSGIKPPEDDRAVVVMDIDDILPPNFHYSRHSTSSCKDCMEVAINSRRNLMLRLYNNIQDSGWPLILLTRRAEEQHNAITEHLVSAGYKGWTSLIMRSIDEEALSSQEYVSTRRAALERQGYRVASVISSDMDVLSRPSVVKRVFKLPNLNFHVQHIVGVGAGSIK